MKARRFLPFAYEMPSLVTEIASSSQMWQFRGLADSRCQVGESLPVAPLARITGNPEVTPKFVVPFPGEKTVRPASDFKKRAPAKADVDD